MTEVIKSQQDLKQAVSEAEAKFATMPTPQYPEDYRDRELYGLFSTVLSKEMANIRFQHQHTHGGILPDFGCDAANSNYLEVLAALDYAEDIMSFNCDDYVYEDVDKPFAKIREVLEQRIARGVISAKLQWDKRDSKKS